MRKFGNVELCSCPKCKKCNVYTIEAEICIFCRRGNHAN